MKDPAIKRQETNPPLPDSENAIIVRETHEGINIRRSQAAKRMFQNPEYRESVLARVRSPEFQAKGRKARAKRFKKDPDIFKRRGKALRDHRFEQLEKLLGGDPKQVLEDLHHKQQLSQKDIADRFHKTPAAVCKWFKRFGIVTSTSISAKTVRKRRAGRLEQLLGGDPKQVLEDLHYKQGLSQTAIAHRFHMTPSPVGQWFKKFGIVTIINNSHKTGGAIHKEARVLVLSAIKNGSFETLSHRQKELLILRYPQTGKPLTFDEIAEKMEISRQRVHQLEKTALLYLQKYRLNVGVR